MPPLTDAFATKSLRPRPTIDADDNTSGNMKETKPTMQPRLHQPARKSNRTESQARLTLEICRGCTRFPLRPVVGRRFLIGGGICCDLRLGGEEIPSLHSLLLAEDDQIVLEAIVQTPPLKVNGQHVEHAEIKDGDIIEIGTFQLLVHAAQLPQTSISEPHMTQYDKLPEDIAQSIPDETKLEDLTAAELVERIEQEQAMVDDFEGRRRQGADALLAAALEQAKRGTAGEAVDNDVSEPTRLRMVEANESAESEQPVVVNTAEAVLEEAQQLLRLMKDYAQQIDERTQQISEEGRQSIPTSTQLALMQKQINQRLDELIQQAAAVSDDEPPQTFRIIA